MNIKFSNQEPPIYPMLLTRFGGAPWEESDEVITYNGTIYARRLPLPPDVIEHELVHLKAQAEYPGGADQYAARYCADNTFRLEQELLAYRRQLNFIHGSLAMMARPAGRNTLYYRAKKKLAEDLSSMYDFGLTYEAALEML